MANKEKLVDLLIRQGKIRQEDFSSWKNLSNLEAEKRLKSEYMISDGDVARLYAQLYHWPFINLKESRQIPQETLEAIPANLAREHKIIAYSLEKKEPPAKEILRIAVSCPGRLDTLEQMVKDLEEKQKYKVEFAIVSPEDFASTALQYKSYFQEPAKVNLPARPAPAMPSHIASSLKSVDLSKIQIPLEVITKFPEDIARKYQMLVFAVPHPSLIKVAVVNPQDRRVREILDFVKEKNDIAIEEFRTTAEQIEAAMRFYKKPEPYQPVIPPATSQRPVVIKPTEIKEEKKIVTPAKVLPSAPAKEEVPEVKGHPGQIQEVRPEETDLDNFLGERIRTVEDLQKIAETGFVPKIVAAAIVLAVLRKASDIHIEPAEENLRIRFRIDGILRDVIKLPLEIHPAMISRIKILSKLKIDETRIPQDGRFDVVAGGHNIDLRISTLPTVHGEKVAARLLDKSAHFYTLEELGLTGRNLKLLVANIEKPYGIIMSTGPTGSGKSTTLYAILNRISNASVNIITLEDPVEYEIPGINQCQIKPKIGFTFANGLRSILRQDPNIIMVGEIRDSETASLATHAALTGHLVLSTLHTNDAAGALPRIINMGVEPFLITSSINCLVAQRLVRKLCPKCRRPAQIPEPVMREIIKELEPFNLPQPFRFYEGRGCAECEQGYKGRIGIFEVLAMTEKVENLVITRRPSSEIKVEAAKEGMVTMKQDGLIKALKGMTTVNEVLRVVTV